MFILLKIFAVSGILSSTLAFQINDNFTFTSPESIPKGKAFQVSLITSAEYFDAEELELIFIPRFGITLKSASVNSLNGLSKINPSNITVNGFSETGFQLIIDLKDSALIGNSFFQLLLEFDSGKEDKAELYFSGLLKKDKEDSEYLNSSVEKLASDVPHFFRFEINFYEPVKSYDQCIKIIPNSILSIPLNYDFKNNLFSEFWIKLEKSPQTFLKIRNISSDQFEYQLLTNEYQMLSAESRYNYQRQINPHFISDKIWYHISILFDVENKAVQFYCDGNLFGVVEMPENTDPADFIFLFSNSSSNISFYAEQFRLTDLAEDPECMFRNKNYMTSTCENSRTVFQINFSENEINDLQSSHKVSFDNIRFSKSDAPIHPLVPELNVNILNNYFEIDFSAGDYRNVSQFVIEKSEDDREFYPVKKFDVENNKHKNYSCLVDKVDESELIYFRLKQINNDGVEMYSSQIKIGQGLIEDIILGQNYPNPFNPATQIEFELLQDGEAKVTVFNLGGQEISKLHEGFLSKGIHQFKFDGSELPSGIYLIRVSTANFTQARKMILAK